MAKGKITSKKINATERKTCAAKLDTITSGRIVQIIPEMKATMRIMLTNTMIVVEMKEKLKIMSST